MARARQYDMGLACRLGPGGTTWAWRVGSGPAVRHGLGVSARARRYDSVLTGVLSRRRRRRAHFFACTWFSSVLLNTFGAGGPCPGAPGSRPAGSQRAKRRPSAACHGLRNACAAVATCSGRTELIGQQSVQHRDRVGRVQHRHNARVDGGRILAIGAGQRSGDQYLRQTGVPEGDRRLPEPGVAAGAAPRIRRRSGSAGRRRRSAATRRDRSGSAEPSTGRRPGSAMARIRRRRRR